jgi:hypothetical protein
MVLETLVSSAFNNLTQLAAQENFIAACLTVIKYNGQLQCEETQQSCAISDTPALAISKQIL